MRKLLFIIICFLALHTTCFAMSNVAKPSVDWNYITGGAAYRGEYYTNTNQLTPVNNTYEGSYQGFYLFFHIDPMNRSNLPHDYENLNLTIMYQYFDSLTYGSFAFCTTANTVDFDIVGNNHVSGGRASIVYTDAVCTFKATDAPSGYVEGFIGYAFFRLKDINVSTLEVGEYAYIDFNAYLYTSADILFSPLGLSELTNYDTYSSYYNVYKDNGLNSNAVVDSLDLISEYIVYSYTQDGVLINAIQNPSVNAGPFKDFFDNFNDTDHGGISSIVTSPLRLIYSLSSTCQPVKLSVFDKDVTIPCGTTIFWNKQDVSTFKTTWNVLIGGLIIYNLLKKLFKVIQNVKDPDNDKVEVMSL